MWACFDGSQHGTMIFTAANGDQLSGGFEGTWEGEPQVFVSFEGTFCITKDANTGRFEGATATGTYWGTAEAGEGRWRGQIEHVQSGEGAAFLDAEGMWRFVRQFGIAAGDESTADEQNHHTPATRADN